MAYTRAEIEAKIDALFKNWEGARYVDGTRMNAFLHELSDSVLFTDELSGSAPIAGEINPVDLVNGKFAIVHNFDTNYVKVIVYDAQGYLLGRTHVSVQKNSTNQLTLDFHGDISQNYSYAVIKVA